MRLSVLYYANGRVAPMPIAVCEWILWMYCYAMRVCLSLSLSLSWWMSVYVARVFHAERMLFVLPDSLSVKCDRFVYFAEGESHAMCVCVTGEVKTCLEKLFTQFHEQFFSHFQHRFFPSLTRRISIHCLQDVCTWWFCTNELCLHKLLWNGTKQYTRNGFW